MAEPPQDIVTRFAPSPTGRLHLGHALSAVLNYRRARRAGGKLLIRIENIDTARCRPEFLQGILDDLSWLGIDWDMFEVQSEHAVRHAAALAQLRTLGVAYRCICTRAEVAASASAPHGDYGVRYPGTCRRTPVRDDDIRPFAWRLDSAKAAALTGTAGPYDDIVLARKGLGVAYHLAVVVDDAAAGVTDVIRGADLLSATPVQNLLQRLLGLLEPRYLHHRLIAGPDGKRLAKRTPGATLADLRADGVDPVDVRRMLIEDRLPVGFAWVSP